MYIVIIWILSALFSITLVLGRGAGSIINTHLFKTSFGVFMNFLEYYEESHQNPTNRFCHLIGIPLILLSILLMVASNLKVGAVLFAIGWGFQFIGHTYEGISPSFVKNPLHLFSGALWFFIQLKDLIGSKIRRRINV